MKAMSKRLADLESVAKASGKQHLILKHSSWDQDLVLDHYGRDRIGRNDEILFVGYNDETGEPMPYAAGYFDSDGRWAELCAKHGLPHRDHGEVNPYLQPGGWSDVAGEAR